MRDVKIYLGIDERKIYNLTDIILNFSEYFNCEFDQLKAFFTHYEVISWDEVKKYILNCSDRLYERRFSCEICLEDVLEERFIDYEYFNKVLEILSKKSLMYLNLLEYLASRMNDLEREYEYEKVLNNLEVFHYASILKGSDLILFLKELATLIHQFQNALMKVNCLETYHSQTIDSFARQVGGDSIYPSSSLEFSKSREFDGNILLRVPCDFKCRKKCVKC